MAEKKIVAYKGKQRAEFTQFIWRNMGKNKNGWIPEDTNNLKVAKAKEDTEAAQEFKKIIDRAKGHQVDGNFQKAIDLYEQAKAIKDTAPVRKKIEELSAVLAAEGATEKTPPPAKKKAPAKKKSTEEKKYEALIKKAKAAEKKEEYESASDLYTQAYEIIQTDEVRVKIEEMEDLSL